MLLRLVSTDVESLVDTTKDPGVFDTSTEKPQEIQCRVKTLLVRVSYSAFVMV